MTIKIKPDVVKKDYYDIFVLGTQKTMIHESMEREQLINFAQEINNELCPLIGEENLFETE